MARETDMWRWLKKATLSMKDDLQIERIENSIGAGFPDVEGCVRFERAFTIELKQTARPKRESTLIRFKVRDEQVTWNRIRWELNGSAWFLCQLGSGHDRTLYLIPGCYGAELLAGVTRDRLALLAANDCRHKAKPKPEDIVQLAATGFAAISLTGL